MSAEAGSAAREWADALAAWKIPDEILAAAPQSPWGFDPSLFRVDDALDTPSRQCALDALGVGGTVVDVGAGAGAASLPLCPPAGFVTAVDESEPMLAAFAAAADERGIGHREILGRWPDVAADVDPVDVVVCHHVVYNVADIVPFVTALSERADRRVVVECSAEHPSVPLAPLWRHFWGLDRPDGPRVDDLLAVLHECGVTPHVRTWERPSRWTEADRPAVVAFTRRRLCLDAERDAEIDRLLGSVELPPRQVATVWW